MVRSYWIGPVLLVLAVTGLAWGQALPSGSTPAAPKEKTITVQETDKPPLKCKVLKMWHEADGNRALLVQAVTSGEMLTIVQTTATPGDQGKIAATTIYHWGDETKTPRGAPAAPADATVLGTPRNSVEFPKTPYPPKTPGDMQKVAAVGQKWPEAFQPEAANAKPVTSAAPTTVAHRPTMAGKQADADKVWPAAFAPEDTSPKPAMPIQMIGLDTKKGGPVIDPTAPGMPIQIKGNTKNTVGGTGPKPVVTEIVRGDDKTTPGGVTYVPSVNGIGNKTVVQVPTNAVSVVEPNTTDTEPQVATAIDASKLPDWHQSWSKVEKTPAAVKKPEPPQPVVKVEPVKKPEPPRPVEALPVVKAEPVKKPEPPHTVVEAPVVQAETKKPDAKKGDLPHAETKKIDPLMQPDRYTKVPGAGDAKPVPAVKSTTTDAAVSTVKAPVTPLPELTKPAPAIPAAPLGMGSVAAAKIDEPAVQTPTKPVAQAGPVNPYIGANAFGPAPQMPVAPKPEVAAVQPTSYAQDNLAPPAMPPQYQPSTVQIPMDRGVPRGMTNAFTSGGTTRPIPSDFGQPSTGGNAFTPANQADPQVAARQIPPTAYNGPNTVVAMMDRRPAAVQAQPVLESVPAAGSNTPQLLAVLRDSLYPSQREWAADSLASQRGSQSQAQVVSALISAAKDDPAPTVRAGCVRAIAQLQITSTPAVAALQALKNDPDARVRREVELALPVLTAGQPTPLDASVRPASGH